VIFGISYPRWIGKETILRLLISGSSGFVGRALKSFLAQQGHLVVALKREAKPHEKEVVLWSPDRGLLDPHYFENFDAVIHLAAANIFQGKWTEERKEELFNSRCHDTRLLSETLAHLRHPPSLFLSVSAIGFYGDCGQNRVNESYPQGQGFLAELCAHWERASMPARDRGIRVIHPRLGIVLGPGGGILASLIPLFSKGIGAILNGGEQGISWIALEDLLRAFDWLLRSSSLSGPINITAPHPVSQVFFAKSLATALHKKVRFRLPRWLLKLLYGEKAELFLSSCYALPKILEENDFSFLYPELSLLWRHLF
jgi:uncharacterized protein